MQKNQFTHARIRLTAFYTLVTMTIVFLFSVALYASLEKNLKDVINDSFGFPQQKYLVFQKSIADIERTIIMTDIVLLIIVIGSGYAIAGRTLQPIRSNMEAQKKFLADASHDLRTPLAIMKSESQVLLQSNSPHVSDYKTSIESNLEEINKMKLLVDDLLIMARSEDTTIRDRAETIDLQKIIVSIVRKMQQQAQDNNISLSITSSGSKMIKGNTHKLTRVFQNIIQNALNYTNSGGSVTVSSTTHNGSHVFTITDTGVGISPSDLQHVFDRFYKAEHSRNDTSGSGLGLSIAQQFVHEHSGTISLESEKGKGTQVTIVLPKV